MTYFENMQVKKAINAFRSRVMRRMTKNIGIALDEKRGKINRNDEIKTILVCRPNHRLGNLLLLTPLLQEIADVYPDAKVDLFVKGSIAPVLFKHYGNVNQIIQLPRRPFQQFHKYLLGWIVMKRRQYDMVINAVNHSSSGRLSVRLANAKYKLFGDLDQEVRSKFPDSRHMAKQPVYSFRQFVKQLGIHDNETPVRSLDLRLNYDEIKTGKRILDGLVSADKKTISIFTYATGAKCYAKSWWLKFYNILKTMYPEFNIIEILPVENVSQIDFKAPVFYSKDIREIGAVIANTVLFIGADSGMMHLASAAQIPTVGLFKVTNPATYEPYNNKSKGVTANDDNVGDWVKYIDEILEADRVFVV